MSSSIITRFNLTVAGEPISFANPFIVPSLALEENPAITTFVLPPSTTVQLWDGSHPFTSFGVWAALATGDCDVEFLVNDGQSVLTHFLRGGGYPIYLPGNASYVGGLSGTLGSITSINAKSRNTLINIQLTQLIGKVAP